MFSLVQLSEMYMYIYFAMNMVIAENTVPILSLTYNLPADLPLKEDKDQYPNFQQAENEAMYLNFPI